jgi:hypothetical protein
VLGLHGFMNNDDMAPPEFNAIADLELGGSQVVNGIQVNGCEREQASVGSPGSNLAWLTNCMSSAPTIKTSEPLKLPPFSAKRFLACFNMAVTAGYGACQLGTMFRF